MECLNRMAGLKGHRKVIIPCDRRERELPGRSWGTLGLAPRVKVFDLRDHSAHFLLCDGPGRARYTQEWDEHVDWLAKMLPDKKFRPVFIETERADGKFKTQAEYEAALAAHRKAAIHEMLMLMAKP